MKQRVAQAAGAPQNTHAPYANHCPADVSRQQDQCPEGAVALLYNNGTGYAVQCYLYLQGGRSSNSLCGR